MPVALDRALPAKAAETTVAAKWSPPPVVSSTVTWASGRAARMRAANFVGGDGMAAV